MIKKNVDIIEKEIQSFKAFIDELCMRFLKEKNAIETDTAKMNGKYTDEYITELKNNTLKTARDRTEKEILQKQAKTLDAVNNELSRIDKKIKNYFMQSTSAEFSNIVGLIMSSGVELSEYELQYLSKSANTYFEKKTVNELIKKYYKSEGVEHIDNSKLLEMPDMQEIVMLFSKYSQEAVDYIENYKGEQMELAAAPMSSKSTWVSKTKCHFFENETGKKLSESFAHEESLQPKKSLTESEKKLIDAIIDGDYPSLAKGQVKEICGLNEELEQLFLLDDRYAAFAEEARREREV